MPVACQALRPKVRRLLVSLPYRGSIKAAVTTATASAASAVRAVDVSSANASKAVVRGVTGIASRAMVKSARIAARGVATSIGHRR